MYLFPLSVLPQRCCNRKHSRPSFSSGSTSGGAVDNAIIHQSAEWADRTRVLARVSKEGNTLQFASRILRTDREIALAAVSDNGLALRHVVELNTDREVVIAAVRQNGHALEFASRDLRCDKDVVIHAIRNEGTSLVYAGDSIRSDARMCSVAGASDGEALQYFGQEVIANKDNRGIVLDALGNTKAAKASAPRSIVQLDRLNRTESFGHDFEGQHAAELREEKRAHMLTRRTTEGAQKTLSPSGRSNILTIFTKGTPQKTLARTLAPPQIREG